ncbi:MAG: hypothetical protein C5B60_10545 [Chloroflexi bacterium]|nr:MAG: hypothetical protein C5B60_10545 [Chloroflexota bacterium]
MDDMMTNYVQLIKAANGIRRACFTLGNGSAVFTTGIATLETPAREALIEVIDAHELNQARETLGQLSTLVNR